MLDNAGAAAPDLIPFCRTDSSRTTRTPRRCLTSKVACGAASVQSGGECDRDGGGEACARSRSFLPRAASISIVQPHPAHRAFGLVAALGGEVEPVEGAHQQLGASVMGRDDLKGGCSRHAKRLDAPPRLSHERGMMT